VARDPRSRGHPKGLSRPREAPGDSHPPEAGNTPVGVSVSGTPSAGLGDGVAGASGEGLDAHDLEITERFFAKSGELTIFISRFIPVIRHLISIPAGMGKMNLWKFCIYTIIGAGLWNSFLTYVGFKLKENWTEVMKYSHTIDIVVVAVLGLAFLYYAYKIYLNLTKKNTVS